MVQPAGHTRRRPWVVGNWKMHKTVSEACAFVQDLLKNLSDLTRQVEVVLAPPFTVLHAMSKVTEGTSLTLAAQDVFWEDQGAFTGEVSASQLTDVGCKAVLIGHSERRQYFFETNETVSKKTEKALSHQLTPIVCIGETLEEREAGRTASVLESQIKNGLDKVQETEAPNLVVAYEPVWAIGTGSVAKREQIEEAHRLIRKGISAMLGTSAEGIPILYGGSVTPQNIKELVGIEDLDGVLVGGAALEPAKFVEIVRVMAAHNQRK